MHVEILISIFRVLYLNSMVIATFFTFSSYESTRFTKLFKYYNGYSQWMRVGLTPKTMT